MLLFRDARYSFWGISVSICPFLFLEGPASALVADGRLTENPSGPFEVGRSLHQRDSWRIVAIGRWKEVLDCEWSFLRLGLHPG